MRHVKGLRIDWNSGEGEVALPEDFTDQDPLFRADVLQDWMGLITKLYWEARADMRKEWKTLPKPSASSG